MKFFQRIEEGERISGAVLSLTDRGWHVMLARWGKGGLRLSFRRGRYTTYLDIVYGKRNGQGYAFPLLHREHPARY